MSEEFLKIFLPLSSCTDTTDVSETSQMSVRRHRVSETPQMSVRRHRGDNDETPQMSVRRHRCQ